MGCTPPASPPVFFCGFGARRRPQLAMNHGIHAPLVEHVAASLQRPEEQADETSQQQGRRGDVGLEGRGQVTPRRQGLDRSDSYEDVVDKGASWRVLLSFAGISVGFSTSPLPLVHSQILKRGKISESEYDCGPLLFPSGIYLLRSNVNTFFPLARLRRPSSYFLHPSSWSDSRFDPLPHPLKAGADA